MMKPRRPQQLDIIDWIDKQVENDRPRWTPSTAIDAFRQHIKAFHDTAVTGDWDAQHDAIWHINRLIGQIHDDSEHWEHNSRDGTTSTWFTRRWLLQATHHQDGEPLYLGQAFAENAVLDGEQVLLVCDGLATVTVFVLTPGKQKRRFHSGLGMTPFHALKGRTPLVHRV